MIFAGLAGASIGALATYYIQKSRKTVRDAGETSHDCSHMITGVLSPFMQKMDLYFLIQDENKEIIFRSDKVANYLTDHYGPDKQCTVDDFFSKFHLDCENSAAHIQTYELIQSQPDMPYQEEMRGLDGRLYYRLTRTLKTEDGTPYRQWSIRDITEFVGDIEEEQFVKEHLELQAKQNAHLAEELFEAREELIKQGKELERLANTDALTGLRNRRSFMNKACKMTMMQDNQIPLYVIMMDIDHFKKVNDTRGHAAGDQCLVSTAKIMMDNAKDDILLGRLGGEEFAVIFPAKTEQEALDCAEHLRRLIEENPVEFEGQTIPLTASFGIALCEAGSHTLDAALDHADKALYDAKNAGRNQVKLYSN